MPENNSLEFIELASADEIHSYQSLPPVVIGDALPNLTVLELCEQFGVKHVIQRSNLQPELESGVAKLMLSKPIEFIENPIQSILSGEWEPGSKASAQYSRPILSSFDKQDHIDDLKKFLSNFKNPRSVVYDILVVADELISNALYNAPYVDELNTKSGPNRDPNNVKVDPARAPVVFAGCDTVRFVLGVKDHYGTLNTNSLLARIKRCYETKIRDQISFGDGGAGIGSFMIFDSCSGLYIAVNKGYSTTVCCSFPVGMSAKRRSELPKNVHILNVRT